jgi:hypothetical protein
MTDSIQFPSVSGLFVKSQPYNNFFDPVELNRYSVGVSPPDCGLCPPRLLGPLMAALGIKYCNEKTFIKLSKIDYIALGFPDAARALL